MYMCDGMEMGDGIMGWDDGMNRQTCPIFSSTLLKVIF